MYLRSCGLTLTEHNAGHVGEIFVEEEGELLGARRKKRVASDAMRPLPARFAASFC
jgi:hypothetical protein